MVDPSMVFIDGTHIKASANKKKFQKEQVRKAAKIYSGELRREVNAEREKLGKKPIEDDDNNNPQNPGGGETAEKTEELSMKWCLYVKKPPIGRLFWQENRYSLSFPSSRKIMVMPHRPATPTSA